MLVRIVRSYPYPDLMRQSPSFSGEWEGVRFTEEAVEECDYLIVFNAPHQRIKTKVPKGNKWLFSQESPIDLYKWHLKSFPYFDKVFTFWDRSFGDNIIHHQGLLPWHINKSYDELMALPNGLLEKKQELSWVTSNATEKPGHQLRMAFKKYLEKVNYPFELYGRGFRPIDDKFDAIYPFKYSLAIENYACNDYWTEKIADCFLSWTMPIYYGCKNILEFFPKEAMIIIDPHQPEEALEKIKKAIENNAWEKNLEAIKESRNLILNKYQLFPNISNKIKAYKRFPPTPIEEITIPANPRPKDSLLKKIKNLF